jgi:maltooligosyltrehalose trehalohydrolase
MSPAGPSRAGLGATPLPDGSTRFRLWAPALDHVVLETGDGRVQRLAPDAQGLFEHVMPRCPAGTAYRYRLPDGTAVPDPASRAQVDDVHGDSLVVDPGAYGWQHPDWRGRPWEQTVIYELHPGLCGGFRGVADELPRLAELGITAIELMPLADFPGRRNWGYDGVLPYAPDRAYGTPDELRALIDQAHGLDLMVFLDVVYNHFGPDGNYLHAYAPPFFREDVQTPWGAAIDFRRPQVRDYFTENALHWIEEYRFDGLRFDAVHAIHDPDWLSHTARTIRAAVGPERHVHLVLENDDNRSELLRRAPDGAHYDAQWNDDAHHALHVLLTGEHEGYYAAYADAPARHLARCLSEGFAYQGETFGPSGHARGTPSADLPPTAFVLFLQNHDQIGNRAFGERLSLLCREPEALRAATALQMLVPMIPLLFMGEPWGSRVPFLYFTDHTDAKLATQVREGRRREFARFSAFSDPATRERIPDPNEPATFERSRPVALEDDVGARIHADEVRHLLRVRREHLVPGLPGCTSLGAEVVGDAAVRARWRLGDGRELTLAANFGAQSLTLDDVPRGVLVHSTRSAQDHAAPAGSGVPLPAYCTAAWIA